MEQKMTPAGPPQPPAAQTEEWTAPTSRGGGWIVLAVLIVAGVAVAAYFIGRSAANAPGAYDRGYAQGRKAMALEFAPGTARYGRSTTPASKPATPPASRPVSARGPRRGPRWASSTARRSAGCGASAQASRRAPERRWAGSRAGSRATTTS